MFTTIQPHEHSEKSDLLDQGLKLRKRVFHDQLGWDVETEGEREVDGYDRSGAATYLVWTDPATGTLLGTIRLLPTEGPTLLHDVFAATHATDPVPRRGDVWEGTRMCIDEAALACHRPGLAPADACALLLLALCEAGLALGIDRLVSNFEAPMTRIYRRAGVACHRHGQADGYGRRPVHCGSFAVTPAVLEAMRAAQGIAAPVFTRSPAFRPIPVRPAATPIPAPLAVPVAA